MIPNVIKYNLHYDDVQGDFLRPPHGTTPATASPSDGSVSYQNGTTCQRVATFSCNTECTILASTTRTCKADKT